MSEYLNIPNTNIKLKEGTIVTIDRFPGVRWITHYGWYNFDGRQYNGWYFCSIPAEMILPANMFDLKLINVVKSKDVSSDIVPLPPDYCHPGPPGPPHHPPRPDVFPPGPPGPYLPGDPPAWPPDCHNKCHPGPHVRPAIFTDRQAAELSSAFISVPNMKHRDMMDTRYIPDGKIVRVNSVEGVPRYYEWDKYADTWKALPELTTLSEFTTTVAEINETIEQLDDKVDSNAEQINSALNDYKEVTDADLASLHQDVAEDRERMDGIQNQVDALSQREEETDADLYDKIADHTQRLDTLEDTLFDVKQIFELSGDNTVVVVKDKTIANSGVAIGDDEIGEPWEYADDKTLATEKAVAKKADSVITRWSAF